MIDFHSHILPGIDDGCRHRSDSVELLRCLQAQGVDTVCLTPHYYCNQCSVEDFLQSRQRSWERLQTVWEDDLPQPLLGAEVLYFRHISQMEQLPQLCLQGTDLLLLEMPFRKWSSREVDEVCDLGRGGELTVMLAHIERYLAWQSASVWNKLRESGIVTQCNAEFFLTSFWPRKALGMLRRGVIDVLGTDTHNSTSRRPRMAEAQKVITRYLGADTWASLENFSYELLEECSL